MPKVSVIIPTHNRPDLLIRALDSVYGQTFQDFEVIVVDDGDSPIAKPFLVGYENKQNFRYLQTDKNQGAPVARNLGIKNARGEFIAFLDDDDRWLPEKLAIQYAALNGESSDVGFSYTAAYFGSPDGKRSHTLNGVFDVFELALTHFKGFLTVTQMFRTTVLNEVNGFDEALPSHQDPELIIRVSKKYRAVAINKPLTIVNTDVGRGSIGGDISKRIKGRELLLSKHVTEYRHYPKKLAKVYFQLYLWYREAAVYNNAVASLEKSIRYHFTLSKVWHLLVISFIKYVHSKNS